MFCSASLGAVNTSDCEKSRRTDAASSLSALLGGSAAPAEIKLDEGGQTFHFCRDCADFIAHPFLNRCQRHGRDTDPMGDCPDFTPRNPQDVRKS